MIAYSLCITQHHLTELILADTRHAPRWFVRPETDSQYCSTVTSLHATSLPLRQTNRLHRCILYYDSQYTLCYVTRHVLCIGE